MASDDLKEGQGVSTLAPGLVAECLRLFAEWEDSYVVADYYPSDASKEELIGALYQVMVGRFPSEPGKQRVGESAPSYVRCGS